MGAGGAKEATQLYWENMASAVVKQHREVDISVVSQIPHEYYMSVLGTRFIGKNAPDVMVLDDSSVYELAEGRQAFERLEHADQFGKIVVTI